MDQHISYSKRLYVLFASLSLIYILAAYTEIKRSELKSQLRAIDTIVMLISLSETHFSKKEPLTQGQLAGFYLSAAHEQLQSDEPPNNDILEGTFVIKRIPRRMTLYNECNFIQSYIRNGKKIFVGTASVPFETLIVDTKTISVLDPRYCGSDLHRKVFLMVDAEQNTTLLGLPGDIAPPLSRLDLFFEELAEFGRFKHRHYIQSGLLNEMQKHIKLNENYTMYSVSSLKSAILNFISNVTGNYYSPSEFNMALSDVFRLREENTSFAGLRAPIIFIVKYGILLIFLVMWEFWRVIISLPNNIIKSNIFWLVLDINSVTGFVGAVIYGIIPLFLAVTTLLFFAVALSPIATMFGFWIDYKQIINFEISDAIYKAPFDVDIGIGATLIVFVGFLFVIVSFLTSVKMVKLSFRAWKNTKLRV